VQEVSDTQKPQHQRINNPHKLVLNVDLISYVLLRAGVGCAEGMHGCIRQKRKHINLHTDCRESEGMLAVKLC
jgi:hypothetical protein